MERFYRFVALRSRMTNNNRVLHLYSYTSTNKVLYTCVTNNLVRRVYEHRNKLVDGFTKKYHVSKLVYYESVENIEAAIQREKYIKNLLRSKKVVLIKSMNPTYRDLYEEIL